MKKAVKTEFVSGYGFRSNGFSVDEAGNIAASSVILTSSNNTNTPADFIVTTITGNSYEGISLPTILIKGNTYIFELNLNPALNLNFAILDSDQSNLYNIGLRHSDGSTGASAQNKNNGRLFFTVPVDAPDTLYYGDSGRDLIGGFFQIAEPVGLFSNLSVTENSLFTGNVDIIGSLSVSELLGDSIEINPNNEIILSVNNGVIVTVTSAGLQITNIDVETGTVSTPPTVNTHIANKQYVDVTSTAFAIALGS